MHSSRRAGNHRAQVSRHCARAASDCGAVPAMSQTSIAPLLTMDFRAPSLLPWGQERCIMSNVQKVSVALTPEFMALLKEAVDTGEYTSASEVIRDALR
ncbi:MAG: ribbon-helix-helix domain-containing protein, partial [Rhodoplanes sp.]